jgi:hypothetical protein
MTYEGFRVLYFGSLFGKNKPARAAGETNARRASHPTTNLAWSELLLAQISRCPRISATAGEHQHNENEFKRLFL